MMRLKIILLLSLISGYIFGQKVQIIEQNKEYKRTEDYMYFEYLYKDLEIPNNLWVANLKGFCSKSGEYQLPQLFNSFWETANKLGANTYRIDSFVNNTSDTIFVSLSIYGLGTTELDKNIIFYPKNKIFVIGDLDTNMRNGKTINFNDTKTTLYPLEYIAHQNNVGEATTVSIGGILGAKVWIRGMENKMPTHLSVTGFGIGPGYYGQLALNINTGRINIVKLNFGQFLVHILKEKKSGSYI